MNHAPLHALGAALGGTWSGPKTPGKEKDGQDQASSRDRPELEYRIDQDRVSDRNSVRVLCNILGRQSGVKKIDPLEGGGIWGGFLRQK